jgi:hypothetical protein
MKNKHKLLFGIIILILAISGYFFKAEIRGFVNGNELIDIDQIPETDNRVLTAAVEAQQIPGTKEYGLFQKYRVEQDEYCIRDCVASCRNDSLEMYKAYVQSFGNCMCKCLPAN